jgi:hypothetical protein
MYLNWLRLLAASGKVRIRSRASRCVVLDKVELRHVFLPLLRFSPVNIIPPLLYIHLRLHNTVSERQAGDAWEPSESKYFFVGSRRALGREVLPHFRGRASGFICDRVLERSLSQLEAGCAGCL